MGGPRFMTAQGTPYKPLDPTHFSIIAPRRNRNMAAVANRGVCVMGILPNPSAANPESGFKRILDVHLS